MLASRDSSEGIDDSNLPVFNSYFKQPKLMTHIHQKFGHRRAEQIPGTLHGQLSCDLVLHAACPGSVQTDRSGPRRLRSPPNFKGLRTKGDKQSPHCKSIVYKEDAPLRSHSPESTLQLEGERNFGQSADDLPIEMKQTVKITFKFSKDSADFRIGREPDNNLWSRAGSILAVDDNSLLEKFCINLDTAASTLRMKHSPRRS